MPRLTVRLTKAGKLSCAVLLAALGLVAWAGAANAQPSGAERAKRLAGDMRADLGRVLRDARQGLAELAQLPSVHEQDAEACIADMTARAGSPRYTVLGAADRAGDLYCLSPPPTSPVSIADRAYFLRAIGSRGLGVGDYQVGRVTGVESVGVGLPVRSEGRISGVVISPVNLAWLGQRVANRRPRRAVDLLVTDAHGTVLARAGRQPTPSGRNLGRRPMVKAMLRERRGVGRFKVSGRLVTTAFRWVARSRGSMRVAVSVRR